MGGVRGGDRVWSSVGEMHNYFDVATTCDGEAQERSLGVTFLPAKASK
jgi:hypothetical protein